MADQQTQYSDTMEIPKGSCDSFLEKRDYLKTVYNVDILFPQDQRSGYYQTMVIKGDPIAIQKARVKLNKILSNWTKEECDYRSRVNRRHQGKR